MRVFSLIIMGLLIHIAGMGQSFSDLTLSISDSDISTGLNKLKPTYDIIKESDFGERSLNSSQSAVRQKSCGYIKNKRKTDGDEFAFVPSDDNCTYKVSCKTKKLEDLIKNEFKLPDYGELEEWTIQFNVLLLNDTYFKIAYNSQDEGDDEEFVSFQIINPKQTEIWYGTAWSSREEGDGQLMEGRAKHFTWIPRMHQIALKCDGDRVYLINKTTNQIKTTPIPASKLSSKSEFQFTIESKNKTRIKDFFFDSPQIRTNRYTKDNTEDKEEYYHQSRNKFAFLSIANHYPDEKSPLGNYPIQESNELMEMYRERNFKVLKSIYGFKNKNVLAEQLQALEAEIKNKDINILYVHYGGHGANLSSSDGHNGDSKHVLIPHGFDALYKKHGNKQNDEIYKYVPTTEWFIEELQKILSKSGHDNEYKLLHVTLDACRNYALGRSYTKIKQSTAIDYFGEVSNVYTILRHAVPNGAKASNNNSYSRQFIDHIKSKVNAKEFMSNEYRKVYEVSGNNKYDDKIFGPKGQLYGTDKILLEDFNLMKQFNEYITDGDSHNDD